MFPSGQWIGHFDQCGIGRQEMHDLTIMFSGDKLQGRGVDCVGAFSLTGRVLLDNRLQMLKKYDDRHHVVYLGEHNGEGAISGVWTLSSDSGTFAIRPVSGFRDDRTEIPERRF